MLDPLEQKIIRKLQEDIPVVNEPFKVIADELGIGEDLLIEKLKYFYKNGILKRLGAVIYHRESGFKANAMVAWKIPDDYVDNAGKYLSSLLEVSHCYERVTCERWEYNIFTMIHGETREACDKIITEISKKINISDYKALYTVRELKKSSMKYFTQAINE